MATTSLTRWMGTSPAHPASLNCPKWIGEAGAYACSVVTVGIADITITRRIRLSSGGTGATGSASTTCQPMSIVGVTSQRRYSSRKPGETPDRG
jgi:hypothetical protein